MQKASHSVIILWIYLWNQQTIKGYYDVSVRLLKYTRDQDCGCDSAFLWGGCHECDVYFQICLQPLSPTLGQICHGNNHDDRVDDTHHFLFPDALRGHDTYTWSNVNGQPTFQISVYVFDYDPFGDNDDLGVTSYTYRDNRPTVQTVTTSSGNKNMRIKLAVNVSYLFMEHKNITIELNPPISLPPTDTIFRTRKGRVSTATCAACTTTSSTTIGPTTITSSTSTTSSLSSASDISIHIISTTPAKTTTNIVQTIAACLTITTPALRTMAEKIALTSRKSSSTKSAKTTTTTVHATASFFTGKTYPPTATSSYAPSTTGTKQTSSTTALSNTTELHSGLTIEHKTGGGRLSILVLGPVSHNQLQNLSQKIKKVFQHQKPEDVHFQSQIAFYHNTTDQFLTKIQIVYNCTQCNHTDDWIKEKVRSALQIMNLTLYQEKTIGKNTIANFKNHTGLVVGVVVSTLLVVVIVLGAVCWYRRKLHQKSKIKGMEVDQSCQNSTVKINEEPPNLEQA